MYSSSEDEIFNFRDEANSDTWSVYRSELAGEDPRLYDSGSNSSIRRPRPEPSFFQSWHDLPDAPRIKRDESVDIEGETIGKPETLLDKLQMAGDDDESYYRILESETHPHTAAMTDHPDNYHYEASRIRRDQATCTGSSSIQNRSTVGAGTGAGAYQKRRGRPRKQKLDPEPESTAVSSPIQAHDDESLPASVSKGKRSRRRARRKFTERDLAKIRETEYRKECAEDERKIKISDDIIEIMCSAPINEIDSVDMNNLLDALKQIRIIDATKKAIEQRIRLCDEDVKEWINRGRTKKPRRRRMPPAITDTTSVIRVGRVKSPSLIDSPSPSTPGGIAEDNKGPRRTKPRKVLCVWCNEWMGQKESLGGE